MIENDKRGKLIIKYKFLHFITYCIGLFIMTPFIWQVAIFEDSRRRWVKAYVNGILGITK